LWLVSQCENNKTYRSTSLSVAAAITDVFQKNGINVSNKFVRILKIFINIYQEGLKSIIADGMPPPSSFGA